MLAGLSPEGILHLSPEGDQPLESRVDSVVCGAECQCWKSPCREMNHLTGGGFGVDYMHAAYNCKWNIERVVM